MVRPIGGNSAASNNPFPIRIVNYAETAIELVQLAVVGANPASNRLTERLRPLYIVVRALNTVIGGVDWTEAMAVRTALAFFACLKLAATLIPIMDAINDLALYELDGVGIETPRAIDIVAAERFE